MRKVKTARQIINGLKADLFKTYGLEFTKPKKYSHAPRDLRVAYEDNSVRNMIILDDALKAVTLLEGGNHERSGLPSLKLEPEDEAALTRRPKARSKTPGRKQPGSTGPDLPG